MAAPRKNLAAVITLLFVAPLVAEYLLGDLPLKFLPALIFLAPAYGGAAVLIRETARRTGRGWPTMLTLGAAYALIGEGLLTQSLFNPDYLKKHLHLLAPAYIPALGIGGWWTLLMLNLHTFWSMGVSIALVEALFPAEAETTWMGGIGDGFVALVFVLGAAANFALGLKQNHFLASRAQLLSAATACALLIVAAFLFPAAKSRVAVGMAPSPWIVGAVAFALGMGILKTQPRWGWLAVATMLAIDVAFLILTSIFSRRTGWSAMHTLALAAGGAMAYGIRAFTAKPLMGSVLGMRISNAVFLAAAIWLIGFAARRVMRYQRQNATANTVESEKSAANLAGAP
jgi:hypothetical protein